MSLGIQYHKGPVYGDKGKLLKQGYQRIKVGNGFVRWNSLGIEVDAFVQMLELYSHNNCSENQFPEDQ